MNGQLALNIFCGAVLILTSPSRLQAKELVFTGELLDARTGEPHPDVGALRIELLSRAQTPDRRGCDAIIPFTRKDRVRVEQIGTWSFHLPDPLVERRVRLSTVERQFLAGAEQRAPGR